MKRSAANSKLKKLNAHAFQKTQIKTIQMIAIKGGGLTRTLYGPNTDYVSI